ncbi:MAG: 23S rRNA (guanosine(2251)-2'-O)-methyltransferase RlmB [Rickettsiales bacterium]|nr:23S rRNA (guanosine(2251)-2'-O)-methyltransferase RlmB [Rickettsiales bacterium]
MLNTKNTRQNQKDNNKNKTPHFANSIWLCGKHAVFSALQKKRRKIFQILVTKNSNAELEKFLHQEHLLNLKNYIKIVDGEYINSLIGRDQVHQGFALNCSTLPIKNQNDLLNELESLSKDKLPNLILLDQLSDPQNIGAIIRSAISFGINKIIFCEHNAPKENSTIVKASAGTIEMADLIMVTNFSNLMEKLKKLGYWCIGLDGSAKNLISTIKDYGKVALVIGSEGNGIRELVKKNCDLLAKIEIAHSVESLNASVATAIALYELSKK